MATTSYGTPYVQSSDLVSGWPTASLNVANRIDAVSYAGNGLNAQTGTTYTLVVGDAGKTITLNNAAAVAVTLPQDSVANLPTGAVVNFYNLGAGTVTISAGAGATLQGGSLTAAQYAYAAVIKLSANTYGPYQPVPTAPGLAIVTPTSTSNSGGSVTVTGSQVAFTTVNSVSLNGIFTSTYDNYRVVFFTTAFSAAADYIFARLRTGGTDASGTNYYAPRIYWSGSSTGSDNATASAFVVGYNYTAYPTAAHFEFDLIRPNVAEFTRISSMGSYLTSGGVPFGFALSGAHNVATAYDSITFLPQTGTMSGTVRIYGYRNS